MYLGMKFHLCHDKYKKFNYKESTKIECKKIHNFLSVQCDLWLNFNKVRKKYYDYWKCDLICNHISRKILAMSS